MSDARPTVSPQLMATIIDSTPDRVRRRLDRTPDAAAQWDWQLDEDGWTIDTSGESVSLPRDHIDSIDQLQCTCLLSPKCFHVLAILTALEVAMGDTEEGLSLDEENAIEQVESATSDDEDVVRPNEKQRHAADELVKSVGQLLRVGVAHAGAVVQSGLLRAVHQCRAEGLHRAAAVGLRVIAGIGQFRSRTPESDPAELAQDVADVLETTRQILTNETVASYWVGTARRRQMPVRPRKLHGLLAEPIVTRSGFAGAAVYFLGEDDRIYTASEVRPGDVQLARDAYLGGIEIGPMIQPAKQLARGLYLGTDLTASRDGRLGKGKIIKIVEQGQSTWQVEAIEKRFAIPLVEQWNAVYRTAALPTDARSAGWDFVFLSGTVLGAFGPELLFQLIEEDRPIRLAVENESETLFFRENLRMLSHSPGLMLRIIARVDLLDPTIVYPLAAAAMEHDSSDPNDPWLELPKSLDGRVFLGFDELHRKSLIHSQATAVVLVEQDVHPIADPLASLRRRWIAMLLSGGISQQKSNRNTVGMETSALHRQGFATGGSLFDALSRSHSGEGPARIDTFLATGLYLRCCRHELAKSRAML